jgi:hypothetical protein
MFDCLAHSDVDPSQWGFRGKEAYERRVYFWNLMSPVLWQVRAFELFFAYPNARYQSLVTGRPPGLLTNYIHCHIPSAQDEELFQQGEAPLGCKQL